MKGIENKSPFTPKVFIGSSVESLPIANTIQQLLNYDFDVKVWNQGVEQLGRNFLNSLQKELNNSHYAIFISNDDDFVKSRNVDSKAPRDNVILEIGLSIGILGAERTFVVYDVNKKTKIPTDLLGISLAGFRMQSNGDLTASLGSVCNKIRNAIRNCNDSKTYKEHLEDKIRSLKKQIRYSEVKGKRLFAYKNYYPIKLDEENKPSIDKEIYSKALFYFLQDEVDDRLAAMDLIYLRENNLNEIGDFLSDDDLILYKRLIEKYEIDANSFSEKNDISLKNYIKIINDIGETFKGIKAEFILHNVRNPIQSIVAAKNTEKISGRKLGDPSTRFVYQFVVHQGRTLLSSMENGSKVSYLKQFNKSKHVKATTIPIYDPKYGLIGIICINIDIDSINHQDSLQKVEFFENYIRNSGKTPAFEREQYEVRSN